MLVKTIRFGVALLVVVALVVGGRILMQRKKQALAQVPKYGMQPTPVRVASARQGELVRSRRYLAVVQPLRVANVSARVTATVDTVFYDEGAAVKAGDILVALDVRQMADSIAGMKAQIEQSQAELAASQATVAALARTSTYWEREAQRDATLAEKGTLPSAQAEGTAEKANDARGKLDVARQKATASEHLIGSLRSRQGELETQLSYGSLSSPFDGVVSQRLVDPGDLAAPGKALMVVEDRSGLKLVFDVPQQDLPEVREGLAAGFTVNGENRTAVISHLYPSLNLARLLRAEVAVAGAPAQGLSAGAYVPLEVVLGVTPDVVLVPAASLIESPERTPHVFAVTAGSTLEARPVKVLGASGDEVAVEGIEAGQEIVLSTFLGWAQPSSGQKVEARR